MDKRRYRQRARADASAATRRRILEAARATLERGPRRRAQGRRGRSGRRRLALDGVPAVWLAGRPLRCARALSARRGGLRGAGGLEPAARCARVLPDVGPDRRPDVRAPAGACPRPLHARRDRPGCRRGCPGDRGRPSARPGPPGARAQAQGYLRDDVCVEEATDMLTVLTSFQAFDELFTGSRPRRRDGRGPADRDGRAIAVPAGPASGRGSTPVL